MYTRVHTPLLWGAPARPAVLTFFFFGLRPAAHQLLDGRHIIPSPRRHFSPHMQENRFALFLLLDRTGGTLRNWVRRRALRDGLRH